MCLAVPGKIVKLEDGQAIIDYGIEKREASVVGDEFKVGDYVIVQGKIVVMKVSDEEAKEALSLYQQSVDNP